MSDQDTFDNNSKQDKSSSSSSKETTNRSTSELNKSLSKVRKKSQRIGILIGLGFVVGALLPYYVDRWIASIYHTAYFLGLILLVLPFGKKEKRKN